MNRKGLTLVELLIAMVILAIGILGLGAGTGWMIRSVEIARIDSNRNAALQAGIEATRSEPFRDVGSGSFKEGDFEVSWSLVESSPNWKLLRFVVAGPGRVPGTPSHQATISVTVADTVDYRILRP
jgi:prepilin-type N-terminal cleavage/methylation domain-containing protein